VDRLLDVDAVEQVCPALQVEAEANRTLPGPPRGRGTDERRQQKDDGRDGQRGEQQLAIEDRSAHDFSRSFSRTSAAAARCTDWIAVRSTWTCTLGAISIVTILSPSAATRPWMPELITTWSFRLSAPRSCSCSFRRFCSGRRRSR